jgi:hypothetical protein
MVPPVRVRNPAAPWECVPSAFWIALMKAPTPAAWMPTAEAYRREGFGSYVGREVDGVVVIVDGGCEDVHAPMNLMATDWSVGRGFLFRNHRVCDRSTFNYRLLCGSVGRVMDMEIDPPEGYRQERQPWYNNLDGPPPFRLQTKFEASRLYARTSCRAHRNLKVYTSLEIQIPCSTASRRFLGMSIRSNRFGKEM